MALKTLTKTRFDALCRVRQPMAEMMSREVEWYADDQERILGIVLFDLVDEDWLWIVLARDGNGLFRCVDIDVNIASKEEARVQLQAKLEHHAKAPDSEFIQGDEGKQKTDLFKPAVAPSKFHPLFELIRQGDHHSAARAIMQEIANAYVDMDGNYVKDFQTTGFNARLWELFLFAFFYEQGFVVHREFQRPDYCLIRGGFPLAVEAVTVNPTRGETVPPHSTDEEQRILREDFFPIKFGSPLFSKLQWRSSRGEAYWDLPHLQGVPFVLAIHDFLDGDSMTWSAPALNDYLYGLRAKWWKDETGKLHIEENPIEKHCWETKTIPSGFFRQPGAENVSAVLFSSSATISKFNRMGKLAGFGNPAVHMMRMGGRHNFDPNATEPAPFCVEVEPGKYKESWSEGVQIFHNPFSRLPIPPEIFAPCAFHFLRDGRRVAMLPDGFVHQSKTIIITPKEKEGAHA